MEWFEYFCSLPCIPNPHETISSFDECSSASINTIEHYDVEVHVNHDEFSLTMYDKFLHLVHTSNNINNNFDALPYFNESQS